MNNRFFSNVVLLTGILFLIIMATIAQGYWALWDYKTQPSSSCLECDIFLDLLFSSILPVFLIAISHVFLFKFSSKKIFRILITALILLSSWWIIDTEIFIEREASWSTYTNVWEVGFRLAVIPILTVGALFLFLFDLLVEKISFKRKS
ncbi:hypothetical protein [Flavobacterium sp. N502536]|uniref:hypothetical protein n=1 Tax=Flavobacterium sp. N502536 TaxID=2986837 RepID=UPI0022226925|nr:hypothetical protein [Flavobacterium sp. N502536]